MTSIQPLDDYTGIADITAAGVEAKVRATVIAIYSRGFLMNDGSASILTYLNAPHEYVVGDVVEVSGTSASYGGLLQFPNTFKSNEIHTMFVGAEDSLNFNSDFLNY